MASKNWHLWTLVSFIVISLILRLSFWGELSFANSQLWAAQSLNFATNWFDEGLLFLRGVLYPQAGSLEFIDPASRVVFYTPFGFFIFPLYWIARLLGEAPSIWMLNVFSFLLHITLAYGVGLVSYELMADFKEKYRRVAFLGAAFFVFFSHKLFLHYTINYWSDLLVLPIVVWILYIELLLQKKKKNLTLITWQQVLILFACLSDSYGLILSLCLLAYLAFQKNTQRVLNIALPLFLAIIALAFYVSKQGSWQVLGQQVAVDFRTMLRPETTLSSLLSGVFLKHLGFYAFLFILSFGLAEYMQRKSLIKSRNIFLLFAPPVVFSILFASKSTSSELSALKFLVPCAIFFFGFLPALLWSNADSLNKKKSEEKLFIQFASAALFVGVIVLFAFNYKNYSKESKKGIESAAQISWIKSITKPEHIIFSSYMTLNYTPAQAAYILRKPIWSFPDSKTTRTWSGIFRDVIDYPLLWLDKDKSNFDECKEFYLDNSATFVGSYEGAHAYFFPSVKSFIQLDPIMLDKCIRITGSSE